MPNMKGRGECIEFLCDLSLNTDKEGKKVGLEIALENAVLGSCPITMFNINGVGTSSSVYFNSSFFLSFPFFFSFAFRIFRAVP
jgi:hypothetical protein